jgi:glycerophosphoryl diester phosphodiesterase
MTSLKKLDIGYGYTADGGKTYPFRGKAIGLMPTLTEVLQAFPDGIVTNRIEVIGPLLKR